MIQRRSATLACLAAVLAILAGCAAPVQKIASGDQVIKERLVVTVADTWNQFDRGVSVPTWTNEGIFVDALQFWVAVKDGELIAPTPSEPKGTKPLPFKATMQTNEIVDLYQALWTRDGSTLTLDKLEPQPVLGGPGFRVEYTLVRKVDEVTLKGVAWGAVKDGQLYLMHFAAPRLSFFARYRPRVEAIVASARVR